MAQILFVWSLRGPRMVIPDRVSSNTSGEVLITARTLSGCIHITWVAVSSRVCCHAIARRRLPAG